MNKLMTFKVEMYDKDWELDLYESSYTDGAPALVLQDSKTNEPFAKLTVNLSPKKPHPGQYFIKGWSENERIVNHLIEERILIPTGETIHLGFVEAIICTLGGDDR